MPKETRLALAYRAIMAMPLDNTVTLGQANKWFWAICQQYGITQADEQGSFFTPEYAMARDAFIRKFEHFLLVSDLAGDDIPRAVKEY